VLVAFDAQAALERAGILVSTAKLPDRAARESFVDNMWRVDQEALSSLSDRTSTDLRKARASGVAHAQMLSTERPDLLARLTRFASVPSMPMGKREPKLDFLCKDNGNLAFRGLILGCGQPMPLAC
jgi:hypothetical protein